MEIKYGFKYRCGHNPWTYMVVSVVNDDIHLCIEYDDGRQSRHTIATRKFIEMGFKIGVYKAV